LSTEFNRSTDGREQLDEEEDEPVELLANGDADQKNKPKVPVWKTKGKGKGAKKSKGKPQNQVVKKQPAKVVEIAQEKTAPEKVTSENSELEEKPISDSESEVLDISDNESEKSHSEGSDVDDSKQDREPSEQEDEAEWDRFQQKVSKKEKVLEAKSKQSHSVHCPYYPEDKQEYWWIYLADRKKHALTSVPVLMTNLVDKEEVELKFTAPPKPGVYTYSVIVRSDSYVDFDVSKSIKLDVKEAKQIVNHPQWDISEEEEDVAKDEDSAVEDSDLLDETDEDDDLDADD